MSSPEAIQNILKNATIFVSVASYRDPECPKTVLDCFEKAAYPHRVFVGICQQNEASDVDCIDGVDAQYHSNIRVHLMHSDEAKGPVYARALVEKHLFNSEDYYLIIDSHTLFQVRWDVDAISQLLMCARPEKSVLTCYPPEYDIETRRLPVDQPATFLKFRDFHPRLRFLQQDPVRYKNTPSKPQPSLFWGAGFSFAPSSMIRECPYDITLEYVFLGEEISMAVRLYTWGYDLYAPKSNIVFHYTSRTYRPVFWENFYKKNGKCRAPDDVRHARKKLESSNNKKIHELLNGVSGMGLGSIRSLADYQRYAGVDFLTKTATQRAKLGLSREQPDNDEELFCKYGMVNFNNT